MCRLMYNPDSTDFFFNHVIKDGVDGGALLDTYLDLIADAGVKTFMCNSNSRETDYRSDAWQSYWEGYDPSGPDDQPFLKPIPAGQIASYRSMVHSCERWTIRAWITCRGRSLAAGCAGCRRG